MPIDSTPVTFDRTVYFPATHFLYRAGVNTYKQLMAVLRRNPWIRTLQPSRFRRVIHAGDWFVFERGVDAIDPLEVTSTTAERFVAEALAIRQARLRRMAAV
jgi:hypothetical protein